MRRPLVTREGLRRHLPELRHAARVTAGAALAFALYEAFQLPQGYWAVFTVIIVMQGSVGGTVGVAVDRMYGTVAGAVIGGAAAAWHPAGPWGLGVALAIATALTALLAGVHPNLKVAPVTAAIMLLSSSGKLGPLHAAAYRVTEIALGSVIGLAATLLVLPARSRQAVVEKVAAAAGLLGDLLEEEALRLHEQAPFDDQPLHERLRAALAGVETAMIDAERQRTALLGDHGVPQAVLRSLWRLRSDGVAVGRALAEPLPEAAGVLAGPAAETLLAETGRIRACAAALASRASPPADGVEAAHEAFRAAFEALRASGRTRELSFAETGRVFSLGFALEGLYRDGADLRQRVEETARGRAAPTPPAAAWRDRLLRRSARDSG